MISSFVWFWIRWRSRSNARRLSLALRRSRVLIIWRRRSRRRLYACIQSSVDWVCDGTSKFNRRGVICKDSIDVVIDCLCNCSLCRTCAITSETMLRSDGWVRECDTGDGGIISSISGISIDSRLFITSLGSTGTPRCSVGVITRSSNNRVNSISINHELTWYKVGFRIGNRVFSTYVTYRIQEVCCWYSQTLSVIQSLQQVSNWFLLIIIELDWIRFCTHRVLIKTQFYYRKVAQGHTVWAPIMSWHV